MKLIQAYQALPTSVLLCLYTLSETHGTAGEILVGVGENVFIMHTERSVFPQLLYQKEEGCKWPSMKVGLRQTGGSKKHGFEVLKACGGERGREREMWVSLAYIEST